MEQYRLSIIIPTLNEENNIRQLVERIGLVLRRNSIIYEIIFIDDHSSDNTRTIIEELFFRYPVFFYLKKGKKGKAQSLMEGFDYAKYDLIAVIDADLQYPPESFPDMLSKIREGYDIVVANRIKSSVCAARKFASRIFSFFFCRILHGLDCDVQAGMKVFRKCVAKEIVFKPSPWTFDLEFLILARNYGYTIGSVDVPFGERLSGRSKISLLKSSYEIGLNAIKLEFKKIPPLAISPGKIHSMVGAGVAFANTRFITHTTLAHDSLAARTFVSWQRDFIIAAAAVLVYGLILRPVGTGILLVGFLSLVYFFDMLFSLYLVAKSLKNPPEIKSDPEEIAVLSDKQLPVYSILCPLYKEAHMLPVFLEAINKLDWPKEKLDVLLLLEEDDKKTIAAAREMDMPFYIRILVVPDSLPKTKPKACNYGICFAKGEYLVIYDAEDIPDPLQLKKAFLGFQKVPETTGCLQAKLNYFNPSQNLLTKLFTAEYSLWFDIVLPALQSINTSIPLGGTSNHFRTKNLLALQGWDPFNVTEDCDLGIRIFKKGFKTAIIDSVTFEEANSDLKNWLRQRSRWIKGYIQTYLVHMRSPIAFVKENGVHALIFQLIIGGKTAFIIINPILWLSTIAYFALNSIVGPTIEKLYPPPVFYMAAASFVFGNFFSVYYYMIGCAKRGQWTLIKYVFLVPFYWALMSAASLVAVYQLIAKPYFWEKTHHGLAFVKSSEGEKVVVGRKDGTEEPEKESEAIPKKLVPWGVFLDSETASPGLRFGMADTGKLFRKITDAISSPAGFFHRIFSGRKMDFLKRAFGNFSDAFANQLSHDGVPQSNTRILIFNWRDTRHIFAGGAEVYIQEIAKNWVAEGCQVTIFCGNDNFSPRNETFEGVKIVRRGGFYSVYIWAFFYYIFRFRGKYDVIIDCQNGIPFFTPVYAKEQVYCLMHHVHQEVFRISLPKFLALLARVLEKNIMPVVYRNTPFITVSDSSKEEIKALGMGKRGIFVINPGVDLKNLVPGKKSYRPVVLYLGRLKAYKSIEVLIKAFDILAGIEPRAVLIIAGSGKESENLKRIAKSFHLNKDQIDFTGKIPEKKKIRLLQKAWVLVNPSFMEGWGIVTIEAAACGTPVVASDVPGLRDSVRNGQTGYLVPYGNSVSLSEHILKIIKDKELRYRMGFNARLWAENFDWHKCSDFFLKVIENREVREAGSELAFYYSARMSRGLPRE